MMGVLVYFHQVRRIGRGTLQGERLTTTRQGIVEFEHAAPEDVLFGDLDMQEDGISIDFQALSTCRPTLHRRGSAVQF